MNDELVKSEKYRKKYMRSHTMQMMTPCYNCIEFECEVNGKVCPLWEKYNKDEDNG